MKKSDWDKIMSEAEWDELILKSVREIVKEHPPEILRVSEDREIQCRYQSGF